jgi:hypothetical protein
MRRKLRCDIAWPCLRSAEADAARAMSDQICNAAGSATAGYVMLLMLRLSGRPTCGIAAAALMCACSSCSVLLMVGPALILR